MLDQDSAGVLEETLLGSFVGELKCEKKYFWLSHQEWQFPFLKLYT